MIKKIIIVLMIITCCLEAKVWTASLVDKDRNIEDYFCYEIKKGYCEEYNAYVKYNPCMIDCDPSVNVCD